MIIFEELRLRGSAAVGKIVTDIWIVRLQLANEQSLLLRYFGFVEAFKKDRLGDGEGPQFVR